MTEETNAGASGTEISWSGVERRRSASAPEAPAETFLPVPADWQHRGMAFLIDMFLYALLHFGGPALGFGILGGFLGVLYITCRDVLFILNLLIPAAIVVEAVAAYRHPERRRLGDRIAKTCVVQKEQVPVLA